MFEGLVVGEFVFFAVWVSREEGRGVERIGEEKGRPGKKVGKGNMECVRDACIGLELTNR